MRSRILVLVVLSMAVFALACQPAPQANDNAAEQAAEEHEQAGHEEQGTETGPEHDHQAEQSDERAAYSKPQEVYDFLGVKQGDRIVDLRAGGGYNTILMAKRVGPEGKVIAQMARPEFKERVSGGDLQELGNVGFVEELSELETGSIDDVVAVRAYHLFSDVPAMLAELHRAMVPGGVVGIVEVRLNQPEGHDMKTHRMGEQTVISDMQAAGFEYVGSSDMLRRDDDDYTVYIPENRQRYHTDRMLLKFRKPDY
ncbi:MAG: methyltransferase domain-containing protein [Acidobacteriota bacterium]